MPLNLLLCVLKKFWCQLPEDGVIITPKHVGSMYKIVRILHFLGYKSSSPLPVFLPQCDRPSFTPIHNTNNK